MPSKIAICEVCEYTVTRYLPPADGTCPHCGEEAFEFYHMERSDLTVSDRTLETAYLELERLIHETSEIEPDPLTDAVFTARDELKQAWEARQ